MDLNLKKPLVFFDIESTGLNIASDGIIEISFVKIMPDNSEIVKTRKIKPWDYENKKQIPISPAAGAVNGVKDEDLTSCPRFIEVACEIADFIRDTDLAGFNSYKFDLPMLAEEFERVRQYCEKRLASGKMTDAEKEMAEKVMSSIDFDLHEYQMVDVQNIFHAMEPRNLKAAYRFYCGGEDFDNAHTAEADTIATYKVLKGQLEKYKEPNPLNNQVLKNDIDFLAEFSKHHKNLDYAGRIILKDGEPIINFGKHKDKSVRWVFENERSYFGWIANGDFTLDTKRQFLKLEQKYKKENSITKPASEEQLQGLLDLFGKK